MSKPNEENRPIGLGEVTHSAATTTFDGTVITVCDNKLMMKTKEGKDHSHILAKDVILTSDGAACAADDLKFGQRVRVTTKKFDRNIAISIEALDKNTDFAQAND